MTNIISSVMKTVYLVLVLASLVHAGFLEQFCAQRCQFGRGGNLCRCNGFHFAGKRTSSDNLLSSDNSRDLYKQFSRKIPAVPQLDVPYYENNKEKSVNRIKEMQLAKTFLRWLMNSVERSQEDSSEGLFGYKDTDSSMTEP